MKCQLHLEIKVAVFVEIRLQERAGFISLLILDVALHANCINIKAGGKAFTFVSSSEKLNKSNVDEMKINVNIT